jgi:tRNA(Arg) A34 adenosine deaminase TadA
MTATEADEALLGRAIALSAEAATRGEDPFGAVIADAAGTVIALGASSLRGSGDVTGHAVINTVRALSALAAAPGGDPPAAPEGATLYASGEPCPMCAAALVRAGVRRVVFAGGPPAPAWSCEELLAQASVPVTLIGPVMQQEAMTVRMLFARYGRPG